MPKNFKVHIRDGEIVADVLVQCAKMLYRYRELDKLANSPPYSSGAKHNLNSYKDIVDEWVREHITI